MRAVIIFILLLLGPLILQAQTLSVYKTFGGLLFQRDSITISAKQVHSLLQENTEAYNEFSAARRNSALASSLGFAGGLLIVVPIGSLLVGAKPEWGFAIAGAALWGISIPFNQAFERHASSAIDTYNQQKSSRVRLKTEVVVGATSIGLRVKF